jgi:outer membrane protein OmpA-like peptidoglycan-associated protein/opacity protein-like surface antigen
MERAGFFLKAWGDSSVLRRLSILFLFMSCALTAKAQTREGRWMLGVQGGGHTMLDDFDTKKFGWGGEALLRYGLSEHFSLGFLTGYNDIKTENSFLLPNIKYTYLKMDAIPAALMGYLYFTPTEEVSPYLYVGGGMVAMKKRDGLGNYIPNSNWQTYSVFPAGVGVEILLNPQLTLGVDLGIRVFGSDNVERLETKAQHDWPDAYPTARIGLNYYFGWGKEAEVEEAPPVITPAPAPVAKPAAPALPLPPELVTPANGATGVATNPTLAWNASSGASSYRLQASSDPTFASTTADQSGITTTSYSLTGLGTGTTYYWHVIATNSAGTSAYSTTWSFTTTAPPPPAVPVVPKEGAVTLEKGKAFILEGVNFERNSSYLTKEAKRTLEKAATALRYHHEVRVKIVGHTDNIGSKKYNDWISLRRANRVKSWLVSRGISAARITTAGAGFSEPIAPNSTPEGRAKNRRIEFHIEK